MRFLFENSLLNFEVMEYQNALVRLIMKHKKILLILIGNLVALFILLSEARAQIRDTRGYIYGRVTTFDNEYQGQIRWGKEEAFWNDYFNVTKIKNEYYESFIDQTGQDKNEEWDFVWDFSSIWEDKFNVTHEFTCQFGDIKSIHDIGKSKITIGLKNGANIRLDATGTNDVGTSLRMKDDELGDLTIKWDRIDRIDFLPTPKNLRLRGGDPIYGTVETYRKGTFIGFIQWDHDERLGEDILDGDNRDGDIEIPFKEIKYIEKRSDGDGCQVVLNSGREFYLDGSNDVDNGNRGIIVTVPGVGKIDIPWRYFRSASFVPADNSGPSYHDYPTPRGIYGTVFTEDGRDYSGKLIYDIDESWEIETLNGNDDKVEYLIPFRNVKSILPKNYAYSMIELRNGDNILLGDSRDVSEDNDGILVFESSNQEPQYIRWSKVAEIVFD